jgi:hypothetical protein
MEFVGIGDLHFDKLEKTLPGIGNQIIAKELRKPLDYALKKGVEHALLYGDIAERALLSYDGHIQFLSVLLDPKYKDLYLWIILGNHDWDEDGSYSLRLLEEVSKWMGLYVPEHKKKIKVITNPRDVLIDDVPFRFLPFPHTKTSSKAANIGHFDSKGAKRDNGRVMKDGVETNHVCFIGHLHIAQKVNNSYYSGTLYQTNFGEPLPKFFHHIEIDEKLRREVRLIPNDPEYKLHNLEIYTRKDFGRIKESEKHLYKLFIQDGVKVNPDDLTRFPNVIKINRFKDDQDLKVQLDEEWKVDDTFGEVFQPEEDVKLFLKEKRVSKDLGKLVLQLNRRMTKSFFTTD